MAGPLPRSWLMGTLAPPSRVAASANDIPVNARTFFLRNIAEITPQRIAPTMTAWINRRMRSIG